MSYHVENWPIGKIADIKAKLGEGFSVAESIHRGPESVQLLLVIDSKGPTSLKPLEKRWSKFRGKDRPIPLASDTADAFGPYR